jgi:hypothetical protein
MSQDNVSNMHNFPIWSYCTVVLINYLCTYDLFGPVRNAFDAGSIHYEGKWEGVGPGNRDFFGPCEIASSRYDAWT